MSTPSESAVRNTGGSIAFDSPKDPVNARSRSPSSSPTSSSLSSSDSGFDRSASPIALNIGDQHPRATEALLQLVTPKRREGKPKDKPRTATKALSSAKRKKNRKKKMEMEKKKRADGEDAGFVSRVAALVAEGADVTAKFYPKSRSIFSSQPTPVFMFFILELQVEALKVCLTSVLPIDFTVTVEGGSSALAYTCWNSAPDEATEAMLRAIVERLETHPLDKADWLHLCRNESVLSLAAESQKLSLIWPIVQNIPQLADRLEPIPLKLVWEWDWMRLSEEERQEHFTVDAENIIRADEPTGKLYRHLTTINSCHRYMRYVARLEIEKVHQWLLEGVDFELVVDDYEHELLYAVMRLLPQLLEIENKTAAEQAPQQQQQQQAYAHGKRARARNPAVSGVESGCRVAGPHDGCHEAKHSPVVEGGVTWRFGFPTNGKRNPPIKERSVEDADEAQDEDHHEEEEEEQTTCSGFPYPEGVSERTRTKKKKMKKNKTVGIESVLDAVMQGLENATMIDFLDWLEMEKRAEMMFNLAARYQKLSPFYELVKTEEIRVQRMFCSDSDSSEGEEAKTGTWKKKTPPARIPLEAVWEWDWMQLSGEERQERFTVDAENIIRADEPK